MDSRNFARYRSLVFKQGEPIEFRASLEGLGNEWKPHHLHLLDVKRIDEFIERDKKLILFQGINFNVTGHLEYEKDYKKLNEALPAILQANQSLESNDTSTN